MQSNKKGCEISKSLFLERFNIHLGNFLCNLVYSGPGLELQDEPDWLSIITKIIPHFHSSLDDMMLLCLISTGHTVPQLCSLPFSDKLDRDTLRGALPLDITGLNWLSQYSLNLSAPGMKNNNPGILSALITYELFSIPNRVDTPKLNIVFFISLCFHPHIYYFIIHTSTLLSHWITYIFHVLMFWLTV